MTLAWVESQLEDALNGANTAKNVYDAAALIIVRDALRAASSDTGTEDAKKSMEAVVLTAHSADLNVVPTIDQAEKALEAVAVRTKEDRERVNRARTWAEILR